MGGEGGRQQVIVISAASPCQVATRGYLAGLCKTRVDIARRSDFLQLLVALGVRGRETLRDSVGGHSAGTLLGMSVSSVLTPMVMVLSKIMRVSLSTQCCLFPVGKSDNPGFCNIFP